MSFDPAEFDKKVDLAGLQEDISKAADGKTDYREVPVGTYEVSLESAEMKATGEKSKNPGSPMATLRFKVLAGEYEGESIFVNQVLTKAFQIHILNELLKGLETEHAIQFDSYSQYAELLLDVAESAEQKEYALKYSKNKKDFPVYEIVEVFDAE